MPDIPEEQEVFSRENRNDDNRPVPAVTKNPGVGKKGRDGFV
jgi:hypothetical protein